MKKNSLSKLIGPEAEKLVFWFGLLVFTFSNFWINFAPILHRSVPFEVDDAYTLIAQSAQIETCFLQDCHALEDLRHQLHLDAAYEGQSSIRFREYKSTFLVYGPLYQVVYSLFHQAGLSWETAFNLVLLAGSILLSIASALFLVHFFGNAGTGLGLLLLSIYVPHGPGLSLMLPKTMALLIALFFWSWMLRKQKHVRLWALPAASLIMVLLHPMGQIYSILTLGLYILEYKRSQKVWPWRESILIYLTLIVIVLPFILGILVERPEMNVFSTEETGRQIGLLEGFVENARTVTSRVQNWITTFWPFSKGFLLLVPLTLVTFTQIYGFLQLSKVVREQVILYGGGLSVFLIASLFYYHPGYPGYIFENIWPLLAAMMCSIIGMSLWGWFKNYAPRLIQALSDLQILNTPNHPALWEGLLVVAILSLSMFQYFSYNFRNYIYTIEHRTNKGQVNLDISQVHTLLKLSLPSDDVLYTDEILMHFFFSNGALTRGAVFYPAIVGTEEEQLFVHKNSDLQFLVTWNPVTYLTKEFWPWEEGTSIQEHGSILTRTEEPLYLRFEDPVNLGSMQILVKTDKYQDGAQVLYIAEENAWILELKLEPNTERWYSVPVESQTFRGVLAITSSEDNAIQLMGIRVDPMSELLWPWDEGLLLSFDYAEDDAGPLIASFSTNELFPGNVGIKILIDTGSMILAQITH